MRGRSGDLRRVAAGLVVVAVVSGGLLAVSAGAGTSDGSFDPGINSPAALKNPDCDPQAMRIKFQEYPAAPCVKPWKAGRNNGGATAQGVTRTTIKVVVLWATPSAQQLAQPGSYLNQATGQPDPNGQKTGVTDWNEVFKHSYETWGRKVDLVFVKATGADEASQRADAVAVAAMKPFAVYDVSGLNQTAGGGLVFQTQLSQRGVPFVYPVPTPPQEASHPSALDAAEFVGQSLAGQNAQWAGDDTMKSERRTFGLLYDSNLDVDFFKAQLEKYGVKLTAEAEYTLPSDTSQYASATQEQAPTLVTRLKSAGVNNVLVLTEYNGAGAATKAATSQEFFPEWTQLGFTGGLDVIARSFFDQRQWAHAFGVTWFEPYVKGLVDPSLAVFQWFWGTDKGTLFLGAIPGLIALYTGVQLAGPKLTAKTFAAARLKNPGIGGYYSKSCCTVEVTPDPLVFGESLVWWSPDTVSTGQLQLGGSAAGSWMYVNGAKRYVSGHFPKSEPKFFDKALSIPAFDAVPASEPKFPTYPCDGCPSSGADSPAPAHE
jgi:hypothetical protein